MTRSLPLAAGLALSSLVMATALVASFMPPESATRTWGDDDDAGSYVAPSASHLLGLDRNGRDIAARLVRSTTAFAGPGLLAAALGVLMGVLGGCAAYFRGPAPRVVGLVLSSVDAVPRLALILLSALAFGGRMWGTALGIAVSFAPTVASELAARVAAFRNEEFIDAARAHGLSSRRILGVHVLWLNSRHLLLKWAAYLFGTMILVETSLSYLGTIEGSMGIGVPEPDPSWGNMLARAKDTLLDPTWPAIVPIAAIVLSIFGFLLLAEGLGSLDMRALGRKGDE